MALGDVNGDNIPDLVIGAYGAFAGYVVFGTKIGFPDPLPLSSLDGTNGSKLFAQYPGVMGWTASAVAVGDVSGHNNGMVDIIIGAPYQYGYTFVYYGHSAPWAATYTLNTYGGTTGYINGVTGVRFDSPITSQPGNFGTAVGIGDVNGDTYPDIIMTSPLLANGGSTFVVFGNNIIFCRRH